MYHRSPQSLLGLFSHCEAFYPTLPFLFFVCVNSVRSSNFGPGGMKFFFRNSTVIAFCKPPSRSTQYHATSVSHSKKSTQHGRSRVFFRVFPFCFSSSLFSFPSLLFSFRSLSFRSQPPTHYLEAVRHHFIHPLSHFPFQSSVFSGLLSSLHLPVHMFSRHVAVDHVSTESIYIYLHFRSKVSSLFLSCWLRV